MLGHSQTMDSTEGFNRVVFISYSVPPKMETEPISETW
jgi:hypothetical protein